MSTKLRYKSPLVAYGSIAKADVKWEHTIRRETIEQVLEVINKKWLHLAMETPERAILDHFGLEEAECEKCGPQTCKFCGESLFQTTWREPDPHACEPVELKPGDRVVSIMGWSGTIKRRGVELWVEYDEGAKHSLSGPILDKTAFRRHHPGDPPEGRKCL